MITKETKASAIAKLKRGFSPEVVSEEFQLPLKLVKEWYDNLDPKDLTSLTANVGAALALVEGITPTQEIIENGDQHLKGKLEEVAIEIVEQVQLTVGTGDIVRAKTLSLCGDTISKLYATFITKAGSGHLPGEGASNTLFERLMRP